MNEKTETPAGDAVTDDTAVLQKQVDAGEVTTEEAAKIGAGLLSDIADSDPEAEQPDKTEASGSGGAGMGDVETDEAHAERVAQEAKERAAFPRQTVTISVGNLDHDLGCQINRFDADNEGLMLEPFTTVERELGRNDGIHIFPVYGDHGDVFRRNCTE